MSENICKSSADVPSSDGGIMTGTSTVQVSCWLCHKKQALFQPAHHSSGHPPRACCPLCPELSIADHVWYIFLSERCKGRILRLSCLWEVPGHMFPKPLWFLNLYTVSLYLVPNIVISKHLLLTACYFLTVPLVALHWDKPEQCLYVSNWKQNT